MAFACHAKPGTLAYSAAYGTDPPPRSPRVADYNQARMEQPNQLRMEQRKKPELGLSKYDPPPSFNSLASEVESLCKMDRLDKAFDVLSHMDGLGFRPSYSLYWSLLSACKKEKALLYATQLRLQMNSLILDPNNFLLSDHLISTLVSCHALDAAIEVFHSLPHKTTFSWTALISGFVDCGHDLKALQLYHLMLNEGVQLDEYTCVKLLKACISTMNFGMGKAIHNYARKNGFESNTYVSSTLVTMYGKCDSIADAEDVFGMMQFRSIVAWTAMLVGYVEHGQGMKALQLYRQMREECLVADEQAFACALQACCILAAKEKGITKAGGGRHKVMSLEIVEGLHANARRKGFESNIYVGNLLVSLYAKCGNISTAENVFVGFSRKNVVLWNVMLMGYAEQNQPVKTLQLYSCMLRNGQSPNEHSFVIALQACSLHAELEEADCQEGSWIKARSLKIGEALHTDVLRNKFDSNRYVNSALLNMYGKCGDIMKAKRLFDGLLQRSIVSWNAMLSAYVEQGQMDRALHLYHQMQADGIGLDDVTLLTLLQISGQTGGIEFCKQTYTSIVCCGFDSRPLVAFNLIYAFGKCASMVDAQAIFDALPLSNVVPWNALIAGYAQQGDYKSCLYYFWEMQKTRMRPDGDTFLSLLTACNYSGLVEEGIGHFGTMHTKHGIGPKVEHYAMMVNLLGYAGEFKKVEDLLAKLSVQASFSLWLSLLEVSVKHRNMKLAQHAFERAVRLQPKGATPYVLISNFYSDAGLHDLAHKVEISRQKEGACMKEEVSWIEHKTNLLSFSVSNQGNPQQQQLLNYLWELGREPKVSTDFADLERILENLASDKAKQSLCAHSQLGALVFELLNPPVRRPIRVRKNAHICRDCHTLIKAVSRVKNSFIVIIDHNQAHYFKDGKCSCRDYFYAALSSD